MKLSRACDAYISGVADPERKPLVAIRDGHGIIHRAYYALKDAPLVAKRTGENTSAVFGFTNTLLAVIDDLKPTHLIVAVDLPGPGRSPGDASDCNLASFGRAVGDLMRELALPSSVIFVHSMGCRCAL